ncbi:MAG TPA: helix-turn-helix domain-containing protein [Thermoanaerobaculia bacterium]|jgi:transcriptional regulator GlxA family with amidase domain|nr:helix-turn-helix domain-containing protein [Thermoanaerobaculia bacterium]
MEQVLILALDGVMDSSLAITLDTFRAARAFRERARTRRDVQWHVAGHRKTVRTGGGLRLEAGFTFREVLDGAVRAEWVIVPGLGLTNEAAIATRLRQKDALAAMELLRERRMTKRIAASCSAVFLLAEAGVLAGRAATTTWWLAQTFRERYSDVRLDESRMLVRDGACLTAGSAFAQLDLALAVVTATMGPEIAHLCSRYMLIDRRASQARYMIPSHVRHVDETVIAAERWIDANLSDPITITGLASAVAVSPKTLSRRIVAATGLSPVRFLQRRRVMEAVHLIETTTMTVEAVAEKVGYQDATALRKIIKRELGTTPSTLRAS